MTKALEIQGLKKTYQTHTQALKGVDLSVEPGDFFALLGPNGAGKSTIIGIISSLVNASEGQVKIFGIDIHKDFPAAKRLIGLVPQEFNFNQFETPFDILRFQAGYFGIPLKTAGPRAEELMKLMGLWDKKDRPSRMLSGGMKRRLMIARALMHTPKLLILDEPTAGVDIELRRSMWTIMQELNEQGTTIILTTHYLEEAESLCRNIAIIDQGQIVENTSMKKLLQKLDSEAYILDLSQPLTHENSDLQSKMPNHFKINKVDETRIEIDVQKGTTLNEIFQCLTSAGLEVKSLRNKANRLEELFLTITAPAQTNKASG